MEALWFFSRTSVALVGGCGESIRVQLWWFKPCVCACLREREREREGGGKKPPLEIMATLIDGRWSWKSYRSLHSVFGGLEIR